MIPFLLFYFFHRKSDTAAVGIDTDDFGVDDVAGVDDVRGMTEGMVAELGPVDLIVLDPPRDGVNPKALEKIIRFGVEKMVYLACKPTSLARDLEMLQGRGYQVERMGCVDLFPGTYHVECVVLMSRVEK